MTTLRLLFVAAALFAIAFYESSSTLAVQTQRTAEARGTKCADEGGVCNFRGGGTVYYGAGNLWVARPNSAGGIACNNQTFGDPAPERLKSCFVETNLTATASQGVRCAEENQACAFFGRGTVYYGAGNTWIVQSHTNGANCSNSVFGDPARDRMKACFVVLDSGLPRGVKCADEGQRCQFAGPATVHFGDGAAWITQGHNGGVNCTNAVFGDPVLNRMKSCFVEPAVAQPSGVRCANEGGVCRFQGIGNVYYGAGRVWVMQRHTDSVTCSNAVFGDPALNSAKSCFVAVEQPRQQAPGQRGR